MFKIWLALITISFILIAIHSQSLESLNDHTAASLILVGLKDPATIICEKEGSSIDQQNSEKADSTLIKKEISEKPAPSLTLFKPNQNAGKPDQSTTFRP